MKKYKKVLIDAVLFFAIIGLTLYGVFHGEDLSGLGDAIKECNILWLIPAVPLVLFFIAGESIVIWHMLDCYGIYVKERICFLFFSSWFFFQLCHTVCERRSANADLFHEKGRHTRSDCNSHFACCHDHVQVCAGGRRHWAVAV